jgi:biotin operon repressor
VAASSAETGKDKGEGMTREALTTRSDQEQEERKEAMKRLRLERKQKIAAAAQKVRAQKKVIEALKKMLKEGGKSVPELAAGIGLSSSEVLWYISALRKYGQIAEGEKKGGYFQYLWAGGAVETGDSELEVAS